MGARGPTGAIALALCLVAAPIAAVAAQDRLRGDADGDGRLSLQELQTATWAVMRRADRNGDGRISRSEWSAGRSRIQLALRIAGRRGDAAELNRGGFDRMDADGDGYVTRAEADGFFGRHFATADRDGDGGLDRAELRAVIKPAAR